MLHGLAAGTNWVFRDESAHMAFAFEVIRTVREEEPDLFDAELRAQVVRDDRRGGRLRVAVRRGPAVGRRRRPVGRATCASTSSTAPTSACAQLGMPPRYGARNPFPFMDLQDVQELTNFFERRVSAYQVGVQGEVAFDDAF